LVDIFVRVFHFIQSGQIVLATVHTSYGCCSFQIGLDRSFELCKICYEKNLNIIQADCLFIPVADCRFDAIICIAVIHHFADEERRFRALCELVRVVKPGGKVLVYVWAFEQLKEHQPSVYLQSIMAKKHDSVQSFNESSPSTSQMLSDMQPSSLPVFSKMNSFEQQDFLLPWKSSCAYASHSSRSVLRYYHVYKENELETACALIRGCTIYDRFYEQGNWAVVLQKNAC
uniref:Methyltransf_11 domain-containing protein n=1 Tax=Soboliphyme baturini TaxID=241478 RepID=A0A183IMZ9_9BILA